MQKNQFIYRIQKAIPKHGPHGHLTIAICHKEDSTTDLIFVTWQCNIPDKDNYGWYGCRPKWEHDNYRLLPLLEKFNKANIRWSSTFEEVIDVLHQNNIEQGLYIKLVDKEYRQLFNGMASLSEILQGKFKRYNNQKLFTILAEQQRGLIEEIQESKKIKLEHLIAIAC